MKNNNLFQNKKNLTFIVLAIIFGLFLGIFTKVYLVKALDIGGDEEVQVKSDLNLQGSHKIINLNTDSPSDNDAVSKDYVLNTALGGGTLNSIPKYKSDDSGPLESSVIYDNGGNVGIGTTDPNYKLQVATNNGTNIVNIGDVLSVGDDVSIGGFATITSGASIGGGVSISDGANISGDTIISSGSSLGVGLTDPQFPIDVDGGISATGSIGAEDSIFGNNVDILYDLSVGNGDLATALNVDGNTKLDGELNMYGNNIALNGGWLSGDGYDEGISIDGAGQVGIGTTTMTKALNINGEVDADAFFYTSDRRLKKNIKDLGPSLEKVLKLKGVKFHWKDESKDNKEEIGLIAQEVEKIFPEVVSGQGSDKKSLQYANLIAPLIESIKELNETNQKQWQMIKKLRLKINELEY